MTLNMNLTNAILFLCTLIPYLLTGHEITVSLVFTLISVLKEFRWSI